ncbi:ATP-binding protein [Nonomuraea indica]|uniref:ATP-binding protein n=1 Tax=Nonomuraea indica TaxID=1581193 RepID=A0ABW8A4W8_9ACTN
MTPPCPHTPIQPVEPAAAPGDPGSGPQTGGAQTGGAQGRPRDLLVRLPGLPSQVSRVRRLVAAALGRDHPLYDDCALLASELATNAILHSRSGAGGWFTVAVRTSGAAVRVWVADAGSEEPPCACRTGPRATGGRGLPLLEALSHRWGLSRSGGATTVWFELAHAAGWS